MVQSHFYLLCCVPVLGRGRTSASRWWTAWPHHYRKAARYCGTIYIYIYIFNQRERLAVMCGWDMYGSGFAEIYGFCTCLDSKTLVCWWLEFDFMSSRLWIFEFLNLKQGSLFGDRAVGHPQGPGWPDGAQWEWGSVCRCKVMVYWGKTKRGEKRVCLYLSYVWFIFYVYVCLCVVSIGRSWTWRWAWPSRASRHDTSR